MLFEYTTSDIIIVLFISIAIIRYFFRDKEIKGLNWLIIGGLFLLIDLIFPTDSIVTLLGNTSIRFISLGWHLIAATFVIIGTVKLIFESID